MAAERHSRASTDEQDFVAIDVETANQTSQAFAR